MAFCCREALSNVLHIHRKKDKQSNIYKILSYRSPDGSSSPVLQWAGSRSSSQRRRVLRTGSEAGTFHHTECHISTALSRNSFLLWPCKDGFSRVESSVQTARATDFHDARPRMPSCFSLAPLHHHSLPTMHVSGENSQHLLDA